MKIFPPNAESETLNAGALATHQEAHRERVARVAGTVAHLAGLPNPEAHAKKVTRRSSPDVVLYRPGMSAAFEPGGGNGRALDDDSVDIAVGFLAGSPLGGAVVPRPPSPAFPYLSAPQPSDLPALADLFGLCGQHSEQTPSPAGRRPWRVLFTFASRRRTRHVRATTRLSTLAFKPVKGSHHGRATPQSPLR